MHLPTLLQNVLPHPRRSFLGQVKKLQTTLKKFAKKLEEDMENPAKESRGAAEDSSSTRSAEVPALKASVGCTERARKVRKRFRNV